MHLLYAFVSLASSAPLEYTSARRAAHATRLPHPICGIDGNADFYGLGIRVGIYLQWISSLLANRYVPEAIRNLLITNTIFLLAVAIAAAQATATRDLRKAESLALQHLCFGFLFTVLTVWGFRIRARVKSLGAAFSLAEKSFRLGLSAAICGYGVWFWFVGNNSLSVESCSTVTFVLGKVDTLGPVHYFYQVQSVVLLLVYGWFVVRHCFTWALYAVKSLLNALVPAIILALIDMIWGNNSSPLSTMLFRRWSQTAPLRFWLTINGRSVSPEFSVPTNMLDFPVLNSVILFCWGTAQFWSLLIFKKPVPPKEPPLLRFDVKWIETRVLRLKSFQTRIVWANVFVTLNLACLLWGIAATECTLYWNRVSNVYSVTSTGQLIPLIIGIANFIQITYTIILQKSQPILTDMLLNAFVKSREERKAVDGDKLEQNDTAATAATAESDRYPLKGGFEAVFWKQTPSRRRSIDNLMPTPYLQTMRLGVSPPDVAAMGFLRTKDTATKRRHSHSGSPLEQFEMYDDSLLEISPPDDGPPETASTDPDTSRPVQPTVLRQRSRLPGALLGACVKVAQMILLSFVKKSDALAMVKNIMKFPEDFGGSDSVSETNIDQHRPGSRGARSSMSTTENIFLGLHQNTSLNQHPHRRQTASQRTSQNASQTSSAHPSLSRPPHQRQTSSRTTPRDASPILAPHPSLATSISSPPTSPSVKPLPSQNWGPHLAYTPPHLPEPSTYPRGPLRTLLRLLGTAAGASMPESPQLSATAANFSDMLAELGDIWRERREGKITREEQDELFGDWMEEFRRDYLEQFWHVFSGNAEDLAVLERVVATVLEKEWGVREAKGKWRDA